MPHEEIKKEKNLSAKTMYIKEQRKLKKLDSAACYDY